VEKLEEIASLAPMAICVSHLPKVDPFPYPDYCGQMHHHFPGLPVVAGWWGEAKPSNAPAMENLIVVSTLAEAQQQLLSLRLPEAEAVEPPSEVPSLSSATVTPTLAPAP
jgi:hypothetical protein